MYGQENIPIGSINNLIDQSEVCPTQLNTEGNHTLPLAITFNILVCLPYMVLYGEYPPTLLLKARNRDLESLCNLICIDRCILSDPGVASLLHRWTLQFQEVKLGHIGDAFAQGLKTISPTKIKPAWAQYVYDASRSMGIVLNAPKTRAFSMP